MVLFSSAVWIEFIVGDDELDELTLSLLIFTAGGGGGIVAVVIATASSSCKLRFGLTNGSFKSCSGNFVKESKANLLQDPAAFAL